LGLSFVLTGGKMGLELLPFWKYSTLEANMPESDQIANEFVQLVQRFLRLHPRLVFPDERVASMREQLRDLKASSAANPEERVFLFRILAILRQSETPPTMGELGAELGLPLSSATRMADGLVRANLAERCADPNDRRVVRLCMTDGGRQFIEMGLSFVRERIVQVLNHFSAREQAQLLRLVTKLIDSMQADKQ
jgi:DNA-binding MarR family transcriptional regulator